MIQNDQLTIQLTIKAPFIATIFHLIKKKTKKNQEKNEKKVEQFFFRIFRYCPKKGTKGDAVYIVNTLEEEDEAEEVADKKIKIKKNYKIKKKSKTKKEEEKNRTNFLLYFLAFLKANIKSFPTIYA